MQIQREVFCYLQVSHASKAGFLPPLWRITMEQITSTTPFGAAGVNFIRYRKAVEHRSRQQELAKAGDNGNSEGKIDKWALLRALTDGRAAFALSDRAIAVLDALLTCLPGREIDGALPQIVFPSNRELSARTGGMAPATLRRHLSSLIDAGMIERRDSPNGKRYCRKNEFGEAENAFGFDLSSFAMAATHIHAAAEARKAAEKAIKRLREEVSLLIRDCAKIIAAALEEGRGTPAEWETYAAKLATLSLRLSRAVDGEPLVQRRNCLLALRAAIEEVYLKSLSDQELSANDADFERQYLYSNANTNFDINNENKKEENPAPVGLEIKAGAEMPSPFAKVMRARPNPAIDLNRLLAACPDFSGYARDGIHSWRDAAGIANLVRSMLGISPDAWAQALALMGEHSATITIAAILQRAGSIKSPGGYLRTLTERASAGKFSVLPMLQALERKT
jgi:replication initiation protein RepC